MMMSASHTIDFGSKQDGLNWQVVNDDVMGGRSSSTLEMHDDAMRFTGNLSLANNGGFASIRGPVEKLDLSPYTHVRMRYKSDGRAYGLQMASSLRFYERKYKLILEPHESDDWQVVEFPLNELPEFVMGKRTGKTIPSYTLAKIKRIGIILSDKIEGDFWLEVDAIEFY